MKKGKVRTKKQRRKWWKALSDEEKAEYIRSVQERKRIKREAQGERTIKKRKQPSEENNYLGRGFKWQSKPAMVEITPETKLNWLDWIRFKNSWLND